MKKTIPYLMVLALAGGLSAREAHVEENFTGNNGWGRHAWFGGFYTDQGSVPRASNQNIQPGRLPNGGGGRPTSALALHADFSAAGGAFWGAWINNPRPIAVSGVPADLTRTRLSFTASGTQAGHITVQVHSHGDVNTARPGGTLEARVKLEAAGIAQSFTLPLGEMTPREGRFDPTAPGVSFKFEIRRDWGNGPAETLYITDVVYESI